VFTRYEQKTVNNPAEYFPLNLGFPFFLFRLLQVVYIGFHCKLFVQDYAFPIKTAFRLIKVPV
jgi:hypothetical protein